MQRVLHMALSADGGSQAELLARGSDAGRVSGGNGSARRQHQPAPPRAWPDQQGCPVAQSKAKAGNTVPTAAVGAE